MTNLANETLFYDVRGNKYTIESLLGVMAEENKNALVIENYGNEEYTEYFCVLEEHGEECRLSIIEHSTCKHDNEYTGIKSYIKDQNGNWVVQE